MAPFTPPAADAVRARLLLAARDEFAAAGLGGGRIERLGAAAGSNKAQVFHYFGSKEGLFDATVVHAVTEVVDAVPVDTDDLPAWAGRLHDACVERPWVQRLVAWYRLERGDETPPQELVAANEDTVAAVEHAQRAGVLPRTMRPAVLLGVVSHLAVFWSATVPGSDGGFAAVTPARRRQIVVDAVTALLAGSTRSPR